MIKQQKNKASGKARKHNKTQKNKGGKNDKLICRFRKSHRKGI